MSLLGVGDLTIRYGDDVAVDGLSFSIETGEAVGLVGESGAGKSQAALALLGLLPTSADVTGSIRLDGAELVGAPEATLRSVRGRRIGIVFQDPSLALNPYLSVGRQLVLILESHGLADGPTARERAVDALARVGLPDPARNFSSYPHELSGGMRQRVTIAAALLGEPDRRVDRSTGKAWIPFYTGPGAYLRDWVYEGEGRVVFSIHAGSLEVLDVVYAPTDEDRAPAGDTP